MLYVVLVLVLVAAGLVVAGLITANTLWAWVSVGVSVLAGLVMLAEWLRRRKQAAVAAGKPAAVPDESEDDEKLKADLNPDTVEGEVAGELPVDEPVEEPAAEPAATEPTAVLPAPDDEQPEEPAAVAEAGDPGEEDTDAADLLIVAELDVEVLVVDEYPRYHLAECAWLTDRETIPIAVAEARDLGFTPCSRCTPDAHLAATHRETTKTP
ncbi:hypothetical protein [Amycolatopsis magusensis]|uniref:Uncharacterized protein n=1 Tax=Amycolatopsis magusensis TaxID=882444 RepID=A0ABS4Q2W0_9PSEU|nr:hypothetical protein [Amycolatopsis magusensis]MBP2186022.1 hypothetical protein [Amycolatopsis magusensis]